VDDAIKQMPAASQSKKRPSLAMSRSEEQGLQTLMTQIKRHTDQLQRTKTNLADLEQSVASAKQTVKETFDRALGAVMARRKQLETALEKAEQETVGTLGQRVKDLQASAKALLVCKAQVESKLKGTSQSKDREQQVTTAVGAVMDKVPKDDLGTMYLVFDQGETPLLSFIENYGNVGVGKKKLQVKSAANADLDAAPEEVEEEQEQE